MDTSSPRPGRSSTLGGPGWVPRSGSHAAEVRAGRTWARCGYRSEADPLRAVLIARPPDSIGAVTDAAGQLMTDRVDLGRLRAQTDAVAEAFRAEGVTVHVAHPPPDAPPNVVFLRDLFLVTPEGAVLGRTASAQRAGEERHAALALARAGIPILHTVRGTASFEGADALWADEETVLVGTGFRTDPAGVEALRGVLGEQGVTVLAVALGPGVQHLLGSMVPVGPRRAVVHAAAAGGELRAALRARDYELIEFEPDDEVVRSRSLNIVTLAPGRVLMPAGCPRTRRRLEAAGLETLVVDVGEYVRAAGALGCLTGILHRSAGPPSAGSARDVGSEAGKPPNL
ncbi:dimethylarginine dimethylaminohydrolase family protein [Streptomyces sp. NBRC 110035]|uniref:dimethylarginine dimethylaminohydrolase family protein n=1 Tax=Streptomyces sp. NBRC 110035 TaxID=1547867 RepID=UPI0007C7FD8C|nr:arginine deiminase family protein [Streptomyces sp. NBRC 110035]